MAVMQKYQANDIINDMSDGEVDALKLVRDGVLRNDDTDNDDYRALEENGYIQQVSFEYVRARNSFPGYITTADGDRLLQELDNRPVVQEQTTTVVSDGDAHDVKTLQVLDPNPAENIPESEFKAKPVDNTTAVDGPEPNPGDLGSILEKDKDEATQKADKKAGRGR